MGSAHLISESIKVNFLCDSQRAGAQSSGLDATTVRQCSHFPLHSLSLIN